MIWDTELTTATQNQVSKDHSTQYALIEICFEGMRVSNKGVCMYEADTSELKAC